MNAVSRKFTVALAALTVSTGMTGCASMNNTERGAAGGAGAGGAIGAIIGRQTGNTARGAIIGAVLGGAAGAVIGRRMDRQAEQLESTLPAAEVERVGEGIAVTFESGVLFPFDSDQVLPAGRENLRQLANSLRDYPETEVLIVGHTDSQGTDEYNMGLSQRRAASARQFLVGQGINGARIRVEGRGESEPVADNSSDAGRAQNRRVEVAIFASEEYREQILRENRQ
ncbi:MAG TPA: OmpA family protein [Longimicrobium sp.]|jgi:outer membrane protein OmpA-like peptidoglycan-associated protein|uniref:OmpA family protein n=1 Tax=Longimicrobium sp. TaxID=2029185 RepID=UPI002ED7A762